VRDQPGIDVSAGGFAMDLPPTTASAQRSSMTGAMSVQRAPNKQLADATAAMAKIDAGDIPIHWGDRFELSVLASVLGGKVPGMAGVTYAFRAQHNKSGHGIDIIAIGADSGGKLKTWQIECKWVDVEKGFKHVLEKRSTGIQTGAEWTRNNFILWWEGAHEADKKQLLNAVKATNSGHAVSVEKLMELVTNAEVIIAGPLGAAVAGLMRRMWGSMGALKKFGGRVTRYLEFRPH
jgi:hypothetical protein